MFFFVPSVKAVNARGRQRLITTTPRHRLGSALQNGQVFHVRASGNKTHPQDRLESWGCCRVSVRTWALAGLEVDGIGRHPLFCQIQIFPPVTPDNFRGHFFMFFFGPDLLQPRPWEGWPNAKFRNASFSQPGRPFFWRQSPRIRRLPVPRKPNRFNLKQPIPGYRKSGDQRRNDVAILEIVIFSGWGQDNEEERLCQGTSVWAMK